MENNCRNCVHAKDRFRDSCYCGYYGYIRWKPKKDCWGWTPDPQAEQTEKGEDRNEKG